jgi:hypothetical protein
LAARLQVPVPLVIVTRLPVTPHAPVTVITAALVALLVAETVKVDSYLAVAGAPVKVTVGVALLTINVTLSVAVV